MPRTRRKVPHANVSVRGFARVNLVEHEVDGTPRVVGDSGWFENTLTIDGLRIFVGHAMAAQAGSSQVARAAIGSNTVVASTMTGLGTGEFADAAGAASTANRATQTALGGNVLTATTVGSNSINYSFQWTWFSSQNYLTTTHSLQAIALHGNSNAGGSAFCLALFGMSTVSQNQDVTAEDAEVLALAA